MPIYQMLYGIQNADAAVQSEAGDSRCAAAGDSASVIPSKPESDTLKRIQKKANSPFCTKRCEFVHIEQ